MKIKVERTSNDGNETLVDFSSNYGNSTSIWVGENPTPGRLYDVELEIDDDLVWGKNISTTTKGRTSIALEDGMFVVVGSVISLEEDGCLSIVVGDSVILLEVENAPEDISGLVECRALDVKVYSTNL